MDDLGDKAMLVGWKSLPFLLTLAYLVKLESVCAL